MHYLREKCSSLANRFLNRVEENKDGKVTKYEIYFENIFKILSWQDNSLTLGVFLIINFLFWVTVVFEFRPLGILFLLILLIFLWDSYFETRNYSSYCIQYGDAMNDMLICFSELKKSLILLKKENPSIFSLGAFILFLFLSIIAKNMSGYLLSYIILLEIFFIPLLFKILPPEYSAMIKDMCKSLSSIGGTIAEDELIPFLTNADLVHEDTEDSLLSEKTVDSATNSLASGIGSMPSYLDVAEPQDVIDEDDLIPNRAGTRETGYIPGDLSSESDSENRDMAFDATHFNGESSSEEENLLGTGLKFTDVADKASNSDNKKSNITGMLTNIATMGSSFLTAAIQSAVTSVPIERENSSSDSEFEIISSEDIKE